MTIRDLLASAARDLQPRRITCAFDRGVGRLEAEILLRHVLKKDLAWLYVHDRDDVTASVAKRFRALVSRRKRHEPIAYITGHREFFGLDFRTDKRALIPRPETELLVELALDALRREPSSRDLVWDVGTGSGAVAIAIAKRIAPRKVLATDVSADALLLAKTNATRLKTRNVTFLKSDLLSPSVLRFLSRYRLPSTVYRLFIVANLPYLPLGDRKRLAPDVTKYEPASALFTGRGGLALIEKFLRQLASFDVHFATAFLEFDPPQAKKIRTLARSLFQHATLRIHKDLAKRNRVLEISKR
jgi:release factor glutamine methyltransferase